MSQLIVTPDMCERLRLDMLGSARMMGVNLDAACTPLPERFATRLPFVWIQPLGGTRRDMVVDMTTVTCGVYAATWAAATDAAQLAHAIILNLPYEPDRLSDWKQSTALNLPYEDPDPDRPDLPRVSFTVSLVMKATVRTIDTNPNQTAKGVDYGE